MELKQTLEKPCLLEQKRRFIIQYGQKLGYEIRETEQAWEAWGLTQEEKDAQAEQAQQQRIAMLNITKYDFYKRVCVPNNISYDQLMEMINSSEEIKAAWNLCERLYRGDQVLINAIHQFLPDITDEQLTLIFKGEANEY